MESSPKLRDKPQAIRDLEWVLKSPSLLTACPTLPESFASQNLAEAQDELHTFLAESSGKNEYRVGRYFERLVLFYLKHIRKVEIVANGLQLQEAGRTVGELDFVFRDEVGQLQHWETAVKFYLHFSGSSKCGSHFIGPDSRDNFEKKRQRLFEHQLPLSARRFPDIAEWHAFVKGRIFYHPEHLPPQTIPDLLSPGHLRGLPPIVEAGTGATEGLPARREIANQLLQHERLMMVEHIERLEKELEKQISQRSVA